MSDYQIQHLHYLRSALKDKAVQTIQSLQLTSCNYQVAGNLLKDRYHNIKSIVHTHVRSLFKLPKLNESATALKHLQLLGQPTHSWDTLLIHLVATKLDHTTLQASETKT
ncbi:hypothetical protein PR048_026493 [Dryococelus australis]|uniref:Uncharacterized protein n=1 Tax=Dryococelus australis TaxID=614101 RepID=A0ABQ9GLI4_9NEOP|nr:hypothetical protein PR048_026493 [Dryococelus australis]